MLVILLASMLSVACASNMRMFAGSDVSIESHNFSISAVNFPESTTGSTLQLIQDTTYYDNSSYTPTSKMSGNTARPELRAGIDFIPIDSITLRANAFIHLGKHSLINKQFFIFNPSYTNSYTSTPDPMPTGTAVSVCTSGTCSTVTTTATTYQTSYIYDSTDTGYYPLPGTLPQSQELIQWIQKPYYGMNLAFLYNFSNRLSFGPSYSNSTITIQSTETLAGTAPNNNTSIPNTTTDTPYTNTQPTYSGNFKIFQKTLGILSVYKLTEEVSMNLAFESSRKHTFAKKAIYFNADNSQRLLPSSTEATTSNWNGLSEGMSSSQYTCNYGADCAINTHTANYTTSPYLSINRILNRFSLGFDFYLSDTYPGVNI